MTQARALIIPVTPFQQNCTLVWSQTSKRGAVIDPGGDLAAIQRAIEIRGPETGPLLAQSKILCGAIYEAEERPMEAATQYREVLVLVKRHGSMTKLGAQADSRLAAVLGGKAQGLIPNASQVVGSQN